MISVIVPAYNDEEGLTVTLNSLVRQNIPDNQFEIVVVENGSSDETLRVAQKFEKKYALVTVFLEHTLKGSYSARNKGIKNASGDVLAFIDIDMKVPSNWLEKVQQFMHNHDAQYVGCNVSIEVDPKQRTKSALYNALTGFPIESYIQNDHFVPTCCLIARKEVFDAVGLFDGTLQSGGDFEFGNRVYAAGIKQLFAKKIVMTHPARANLRSLLKKSFRTGAGGRKLISIHPEHEAQIKRGMNAIRTYLPALPHTFVKKMQTRKIWQKMTVSEKFGVYFVDWIYRLANRAGFWYQSLFKRAKIRA